MTNIHNRDKFLANLHEKLGTTPLNVADHPYIPINDLPQTHLADKNVDELLGICKEKVKDIHTELLDIPSSELHNTLKKLIEQSGNGNILLPKDDRFSKELLDFLETEYSSDISYWDEGEEFRDSNIKKAEEANVVIANADFMLAESGSIVVETTPGQGRSLHFLPTHYISLIKKSSIVARSTQVANYFSEKIEKGESVGSAIHFISGPSNSGDIEMQLVVGLHGPLKMYYVVLNDL